MSSSFCVLPFYAYENGNAQSWDQNIYCCRLKKNTDIESVRKSILDNKRSPSCESCWILEDSGLISERQLSNSSLDFYWDRDIRFIEEDAKSGNYETRIVKINSSSVCNGTCITCNASLSSAWASLEGTKKKFFSISPSKWPVVNWGNIIQISFVGGEPLLEKKNFEILELLLSHKNSKCFVTFVTNGSVKLSKDQIDILSKFENLNFCFSIDAIEEKFEYLRYPLKWDLMCTNLKKYSSFSRFQSVSGTVSNLSLPYLDETLQWFSEQKLDYLCKQVNYPKYFSPGILPDAIKKNILKFSVKYKKEVESFANVTPYDKDLWNQFWLEIERQDSLKNISFRSYLPYWYEIEKEFRRTQ